MTSECINMVTQMLRTYTSNILSVSTYMYLHGIFQSHTTLILCHCVCACVRACTCEDFYFVPKQETFCYKTQRDV